MSESTWSPAPAADTYQTVQTMVAGYVLMPTDTEVLETAAAGIRRAIDRLNTRNWNWALTYDDISFVVDQTDYELDVQFKNPRNFELNDADGNSTGRLMFLQWPTLLKENPVVTGSGSPIYYSASNVNLLGTITLDIPPDARFVSATPTGRLWFYRRIAYPAASSTSLDVPSEVIGFIQAHAEGFTADRYAVTKAQPAYSRAERFFHELVVDDCHGGQTDWE
jgi:hypothetical protein